MKKEDEGFLWRKVFSNFRCNGLTVYCGQAGNKGCCWECKRLKECIRKWKHLLKLGKNYDITCPISHMDKWCSQVLLAWEEYEKSQRKTFKKT